MCAVDEYYLTDSCTKNCPIFYYPSHGLINVTSNYDSFEILNVSMCLPCHYTCGYCSGPERSDCTSCPSELKLSKDNQCLETGRGE